MVSPSLFDWAPTPTQRPSRFGTARAFVWSPQGAIALILLVAAVLRFVGIDWDAGQHLHPDERFITIVESQVRLPNGLAEYFDTAHSPLNPYNHDFGSFIYGTLPLFLVRALGEGLQQVGRSIDPTTAPPFLTDLLGHLKNAADYGEVNRIGRILSGVEDLVTIWLVFLMGRRLYGEPIGLLAALFSGLAVLQIQAAHFFTAESSEVLLTTLALYLAVRLAQTNELRSWAFLGIAVGLAIATKLTAGLILLVVLGAAWMVWRRRSPTAASAFSLENLITGLVVGGVSAAIVFRIAQPYAFSGPGFFDLAPNPKYLADLQSWQRIASGQADYPPSDQWTGTTPYVWQLINMAL
ncbi:MAG TPA: glycosyltransferase family 39 protein, partial [Chloroflexota bacterium]